MSEFYPIDALEDVVFSKHGQLVEGYAVERNS